eukprot:14264648-Ditylum_brightwellii.AAC.1
MGTMYRGSVPRSSYTYPRDKWRICHNRVCSPTTTTKGGFEKGHMEIHSRKSEGNNAGILQIKSS